MTTYRIMFDDQTADVANTIESAISRATDLIAAEPFGGSWWIEDDDTGDVVAELGFHGGWFNPIGRP